MKGSDVSSLDGANLSDVNDLFKGPAKAKVAKPTPKRASLQYAPSGPLEFSSRNLIGIYDQADGVSGGGVGILRKMFLFTLFLRPISRNF